MSLNLCIDLKYISQFLHSFIHSFSLIGLQVKLLGEEVVVIIPSLTDGPSSFASLGTISLSLLVCATHFFHCLCLFDWLCVFLILLIAFTCLIQTNLAFSLGIPVTHSRLSQYQSVDIVGTLASIDAGSYAFHFSLGLADVSFSSPASHCMYL